MFSDSEYDALIAELFERHQSVQTSGFSADAYKPGLEAMQRFDKALGSPSKHLKTIHVAGTNGKGSVCTMLAASLATAGKRIGLYTSPHLLDFRERIKIISADGYEMIPREDVWSFLETYEPAAKGLSFFEITTGLAFWYFAKEHIDVAVIETGLGGRLDSTNIITPEAAVISSIGLDHCALLGDTRAKIASEKAGIFKPGIPAIIWGRDTETEPIFRQAATALKAPLFFADGSGNEATVKLALSKLPFKSQFTDLAEASKRTGFRGRWEVLGGAILDIGHNPQALERNFRRLEAEDPEPVIVYGVMADKDYKAAASLFPKGARIILTEPQTPRALPLEELARAVRESRPELTVFEEKEVSSAVWKAKAIADGHKIYIGGSTYVVCEAMRELEK